MVIENMSAITVNDYVIMVLRKNGSQDISRLYDRCVELGLDMPMGEFKREMRRDSRFYIDDNGFIGVRDGL